MKKLVSRLLKPLDIWMGRRQYAVGKELVRRGQYNRAISSFEHSERWVKENLGPTHPYVAATIMKQAWCKAKLGRATESCGDYQRALQAMLKSTDAPHPKILEVERYVREACGG